MVSVEFKTKTVSEKQSESNIWKIKGIYKKNIFMKNKSTMMKTDKYDDSLTTIRDFAFSII
jgi:hypothetical protein